MKQKTAVRLAALLIAISVPVLITLLAVESIAFSEQFYLHQHQKLGLEHATGFSASNYLQFSRALQDYYHGHIASPQIIIPTDYGPQPLYKDHELAHLVDVYHLFRLGFTIRNLAMVLLLTGITLLLTFRKHRAWRIIVTAIGIGSTGGIVLFLLLLLAVKLDFSQAFTYFHLISFDNMLWQLDPAKDNLIKMFPEQFFLNATVAITGRALTVLTILAIFGLILWRRDIP
ncbi:MAG TPA: TIGR01906 family membrane protein [Firmicutes bacterium]|jgi:integral membrane protein (TIGR01906 family)|nr:TIGR01906 family membrane protein [Bacillota bacterium]